MKTENTRNTIIFVVCMAVLLIAYQFFVMSPQAEKRKAELAAQRAVAEQSGQLQGPGATAPWTGTSCSGAPAIARGTWTS